MGSMAFLIKHNFLHLNQHWVLANQTDITNLKLLITLGIVITLFLATVVVLFVVFYQRKMLLKDASIKLMEQEKQIELFKASVEAEEKQKEKIARNLHDEINPILNTLKFNITKHRIKAQKNELNPASMFADEETLNKVIEGIRSVCYDLIPSFFLEYGIIVSLESYVKNVQNMDDISGEFYSDVIPEELETFSRQEQLNMYRVCLEILNNLFKHSECKFFSVSMNSLNKSLVFKVTHNGKGISNEEMNLFTENSKGLGLKSLKARIILLKANINYNKDINSSSITLTVPLNPNKLV